jgi:hypothetical protein
MKTWRVELEESGTITQRVTYCYEIEVEAIDEDEAREKAKKSSTTERTFVQTDKDPEDYQYYDEDIVGVRLIHDDGNPDPVYRPTRAELEAAGQMRLSLQS